MKSLIIRAFKKAEVPKRATITYVDTIEGAQLQSLIDWLLGKNQVHAAKKVLTINIVESDGEEK